MESLNANVVIEVEAVVAAEDVCCYCMKSGEGS